MATRLENLTISFVKRYARSRGQTSSADFNDMIDEIGTDLSNLASQWNSWLEPLLSVVPDGTDDSDVNAFTNGLDGANLYANSSATSLSNSTYFSNPKSRPNTIFEQFQNVYSVITTVQNELEDVIADTLPTANQIEISDIANLYTSSNVESALSEVMDAVNNRVWDTSSIDNSLIPTTTNTIDLGSSSKYWDRCYINNGKVNTLVINDTTTLNATLLEIYENTSSGEICAIESGDSGAGNYTCLYIKADGTGCYGMHINLTNNSGGGVAQYITLDNANGFGQVIEARGNGQISPLYVTHNGGGSSEVIAGYFYTNSSHASTYAIKGEGCNGAHIIGTAGYGAVIQTDTTSPAKAALRIVPQDTVPTTGLVGDICVVGGKLYICTTASTPGPIAWTVVGTQS